MLQWLQAYKKLLFLRFLPQFPLFDQWVACSSAGPAESTRAFPQTQRPCSTLENSGKQTECFLFKNFKNCLFSLLSETRGKPCDKPRAGCSVVEDNWEWVLGLGLELRLQAW